MPPNYKLLVNPVLSALLHFVLFILSADCNEVRPHIIFIIADDLVSKLDFANKYCYLNLSTRYIICTMYM